MTVAGMDLLELLRLAGVEESVIATVRPDAPLLLQGLDSVDFPSFLEALQERYGCSIPDETAWKLRTLDDFAALLNARPDPAQAPTPTNRPESDDQGSTMQFDTETMQQLLVTAGLAATQAEALAPDTPLTGQGVPPAVLDALAGILAERFGAPPAVADLSRSGSLDDWSRFAQSHFDAETVKQAALARIVADETALPTGSPYVLDMLRPEDAPGVNRLFHCIYGDKYPVIDYYVPERLLALNRQKQVLTVVARLATGEIAGQTAFYRSSPPNPAVYEQGQLLVDHAYRNTSIAFRLLKRLEELSHAMDYAEAFFGEAVCTHLVTQKTAVRQNYSVCALELSLMPSGAYAKEGAAGRVTCLVCMRVDRDQPQPLFLPECYREPLTAILSGFTLARDVRFDLPETADVLQAEHSDLSCRTFDFAQVRRVQVATIGRDLPGRLDAIDAEATDQGLAVVQVYLSTGAPGVAFAVAELRRRGYILGGLLPRWFGPDGLMLQKLAVEPDYASVNLLTDQAKALLAHIRAERDAHHGRS
ncbi:acyl carrier protein [Solidesulfovibrio sp.]